jgi:hypothetical protein
MRYFCILLIGLSLLTTACTPGLRFDVAGSVSNSIDSAVDKVIDESIDSLITAATNRVVDSIVAAISRSLFDGTIEVILTEGFSLDVLTGRWDTRISGAAPVSGRFSQQSSPSERADGPVNVGAAIRGTDANGQPVLGINFNEVDANNDRIYDLTVIEAVDAATGLPTREASLQFEEGGDRFVGPVNLVVEDSANDRLVGSLDADALRSETTGEEVAVRSDFDVPVNPVGTALFGFDSGN